MPGTSVGLIGTGRIGNPMAHNLLQAGYTVHVHDIREEAFADLVERGAICQDSACAVTAACEVVILSLMTVNLVEKVLFGRDGAARADLTAKIIVDTSTGIPSQSQRFAARIAGLGGAMLDAPVSGTQEAARAGTLNLMVGGDRDAFRRCKAILDVLGSTVVRVGPSGSGQVASLANQMILSAHSAAIIEAFALIERCNVDTTKVLEAIENGDAQSKQLTVLGTAYRRAQASGKSVAFTVSDDHNASLLNKNLHHVLEEGFRHSCPLPITAAVHELFKRGLAWRCEGSFPLRLIQLWRKK